MYPANPPVDLDAMMEVRRQLALDRAHDLRLGRQAILRQSRTPAGIRIGHDVVRFHAEHLDRVLADEDVLPLAARRKPELEYGERQRGSHVDQAPVRVFRQQPGFLRAGAALFHLAFQVRIGIAQLARHAVELVRQRFQLVAGAHLDALVERAFADARRALLQGTNRRHHAAHQHHARHQRQHQAAEQQHADMLQSGRQRRERLRARLFDEYAPAERRDGGIGAEHRPSRQVEPFHRLHLAGRRTERGAHLRQFRHVGFLQHQREVGMRDQLAALVDRVGIALFADRNAIDAVEQELQIDFGDGDARLFGPGGHRHRDVGFDVAAEVDLAEIRPAGARFLHRHRERMVDAAADDVAAEARHAKPLAAVGVDQDDVRNRRHLPQQSQFLHALGKRILAGLQRCGKTHLMHHFEQGLLDAIRRRFRLFSLQLRQRAAVLVIRKVQTGRAAREQHAAHQRREYHEVFAEQRSLRVVSCLAHCAAGAPVRASCIQSNALSFGFL